MISAVHLLAAGLAALLLIAAWGDLRRRDIPNALTIAIALLVVPWWFVVGLAPWPDMAIQLGIGVALFALFAGLFALGQMGGGDVKLIAALALWLPLGGVLRMLVVMSLAGALITLIAWGWHRARRAEGRAEVPYGVAISIAGLWVFANDILTIPAHW